MERKECHLADIAFIWIALVGLKHGDEEPSGVCILSVSESLVGYAGEVDGFFDRCFE